MPTAQAAAIDVSGAGGRMSARVVRAGIAGGIAGGVVMAVFSMMMLWLAGRFWSR